MPKRVIIIHQHRDAGQTARNWMTAAKIIGALVVLGLLVQYWYVAVALVVIGGGAYCWHQQRKAKDARRIATQANIARLERELGIGAVPTHANED